MHFITLGLFYSKWLSAIGCIIMIIQCLFLTLLIIHILLFKLQTTINVSFSCWYNTDEWIWTFEAAPSVVHYSDICSVLKYLLMQKYQKRRSWIVCLWLRWSADKQEMCLHLACTLYYNEMVTGLLMINMIGCNCMKGIPMLMNHDWSRFKMALLTNEKYIYVSPGFVVVGLQCYRCLLQRYRCIP